jgi:hypothetical protein
MVLLLFAGSSGKRPYAKTGSKMSSKNPDLSKKSIKKFEKISNKKVNKKTLSGIKEFIQTLSDCNSTFKTGNVIGTIFQGIGLLSDSIDNKRLLSFYNDDTKYKKSTIYTTFANIGDDYSKKINQLKNGPIHETESRELLNTKKDALSTPARASLKTNHGVNQRSYSFMKNLHLTVGDVKELTDFELKHKDKIDENFLGYLLNSWKEDQTNMWRQWNKLSKTNPNEENETISKDYDEKVKLRRIGDELVKIRTIETDRSVTNLKSYLKNNNNKKELKQQKKIIRYNAGLLETTLKIQIMNMLPVYESNVRIYLLKFSPTAIATNGATIDKLLSNIMPTYLEDSNKRTDRFTKKFKKFFNGKKEEPLFSDDIERHIEELTAENIKFKPIPMLERVKITNVKKENENEYQYQLVTTLNCNIPRLESFRDRCEVIRHWDKKIGPGDIWKFNLKETFRDGLYLNKLSELTRNHGVSDNTPISYFIMVECYGDACGAVLRKEDQEVFGNVYSPSKLQFEMDFEYKYLAQPENPDEIAVFSRSSNDKQFENQETGAFYYPDRQESLNIDFDDIDLFGAEENKNAKFQLRDSIIKIETQDQDNISSALQDALDYILKKDPNQTLTKDEIEFISTDNSDDEDIDSKEDVLDLDF